MRLPFDVNVMLSLPIVFFSFRSRGNGEITDSVHCSQKRHRAEKANQVEMVLEVVSVGLTLHCYEETVSEEKFGMEFAM